MIHIFNFILQVYVQVPTSILIQLLYFCKYRIYEVVFADRFQHTGRTLCTMIEKFEILE